MTNESTMDLKHHIRGVPDFPKLGILFYDIGTLLRHPAALQAAVAGLADLVRPRAPTILAGIESRGFLFAAPLALALGCGVLLIRKSGKLPGAVTGLDYELEYGTDRLEIQADALSPGARVVLVDDLLATGGTLAAGARLLRLAGANVVAATVLIELRFLDGRSRLDVPLDALLTYDE